MRKKMKKKLSPHSSILIEYLPMQELLEIRTHSILISGTGIKMC